MKLKGFVFSGELLHKQGIQSLYQHLTANFPIMPTLHTASKETSPTKLTDTNCKVPTHQNLLHNLCNNSQLPYMTYRPRVCT
jgi:hypothetical protein